MRVRKQPAFFWIVDGTELKIGVGKFCLIVNSLITHRFPIDKAIKAYEVMASGKEPYIAMLLTYETASEVTSAAPLEQPKGFPKRLGKSAQSN